jgi:DNA repair protein SbcC/Rad50
VLEKIEIKNFQSHEHTVLTLDPHINVITGTSDVGKSSIRRAIEWLQLNRPRGTAFIRNKSKTPTSVSIDLDGTKITRTKSKSKNAYKLDKTEFNVVKTDVPTEVTQFLNLDEVSVQGQHDKYFLLQDSPGEVAKKLNKVAGFEIIDQVMKSVKSEITKNKTDTKYTQEHIDELEIKIAKYEYLEIVEKQLTLINNTVNTYTKKNDLIIEIQNILDKIIDIEEVISKYKHLTKVEKQFTLIKQTIEIFQEKYDFQQYIQNIINEITNIEETITDLDGWLAIDIDIVPILETINALTKQQNKFKIIDQLFFEITAHKKLIKELSVRSDCESNVQDIANLIFERDTQLQAYNSLIVALQNIEKNNQLVTDLTDDLTSYENQLGELLEKHKMCPLCGTKLTTKTTAHIKELL